MRKKKMYAAIAALCMSILAACGNEPTVSENTVSENTQQVETVETTGDTQNTEGPVIEENFENGVGIAVARGDDVTLETVEGGIDGSMALLISGRTDSWNGANFDCNIFRGNTIRVNANVKSTAKTLRISIQYDVDGATVYNWITSAVGGTDSYAFATGTFSIPSDALNIYVYVESDSTDDIYVDDIVIKAEGKYTEPGELEEKVMADTSNYESIKDIYSDYFDIGVCINPAVISNEDYANLILKEFNSATLENDLKPEAIMDKNATLEALDENGGTRIVLNMDSAVDELDFALNNGMKVRGHTLVWHSQTPDWIFYVDFDTNGELASRELMLERLDNYICDVFTWADENYPGLFYAWDVVNEAMEDNGTMRDSLWLQTIGEDYIEQAFAIARKYAPEGVLLFYNDYNTFQSTKQNAIIEMLLPVAQAGNIDGVGMQAHLYTGEEPDHFVAAAAKYAEELGVIIHITEIDVTQPSTNNPEGDQGTYYGDLFAALKQAKIDGVPIESVSIWGLTDSLSWKASEKPLIFNGDLSGKLAFYEIIAAGKDN